MIVAVVAAAIVGALVVLLAEQPWHRPPPQSIEVEIRVDTSEFTAAMARAGRSMAEVARAFGQTTRQATAATVAGQAWADAVAAIADEEHETVRLMFTAGPYRFGELVEIVDDRAELFRLRWAERPTRPPRGMTPRGAALRSVYDDVVTGRL